MRARHHTTPANHAVAIEQLLAFPQRNMITDHIFVEDVRQRSLFALGATLWFSLLRVLSVEHFFHRLAS
jgi:hypothetical protein